MYFDSRIEMTTKLLICHKKRFNKTTPDNSQFTVLKKGSFQVSEQVEMEDCSEKAEQQNSCSAK